MNDRHSVGGGKGMRKEQFHDWQVTLVPAHHGIGLACPAVLSSDEEDWFVY